MLNTKSNFPIFKRSILETQTSDERQRSLGSKLLSNGMVKEPNKLKLYAVLTDQRRTTTIRDYFMIVNPKTIANEKDDKYLLKEFFNWTDDAVAYDETDLTIIVAAKFVADNVTVDKDNRKTHYREPKSPCVISADKQPFLNKEFNVEPTSSYESYKKNFERKQAQSIGPAKKLGRESFLESTQRNLSMSNYAFDREQSIDQNKGKSKFCNSELVNGINFHDFDPESSRCTADNHLKIALDNDDYDTECTDMLDYGNKQRLF